MCLQFLNDKSSVFASAHPNAVSEYVNQHIGSHDIRLQSASKTDAALNHRKLGYIDLCRLTYGAQARVVSEGLDDIYHVQFILRGHCRYEMFRDSSSFSAGHVLVINPNEPLDLTYSDDCEKFILKVPASLVTEACLEHSWFKPHEGIKFSSIPYKFSELESLLYLLTVLCQEAEAGIATPQILNHYNRVVASKLMTMLKHNVSLESHTLQSVSFDRLAQFIEENIKRDITVEELAQRAHMSVRSLYMLFEKNAKTTPKNFIRQKKLERVYATLMDPACKVANITSVALDYGFTHLGRFSEFYKATFGKLPSDSLRERQLRIN